MGYIIFGMDIFVDKPLDTIDGKPKSKKKIKQDENHAALVKKCKEVKRKNDIIFGYIKELEKK